ncbi:helix-turn-helix domain-containing protein [Lysinibacillus capsici]|uniref:helix-turn-helix domain-containing protein n=1 Tax=Lysinibacillus capsici TaxID=2115968 RepID=UPI00272F8DD6|nr:helix-turn-helix domain-containing protein [Lysinibacillus capsici]MDP1394424.1 helix-turn-helix domain-containing protein [Lysinibacillus capsici]MDP1414905.1 helix-turn-helix domain-containing protein [Lysinibacillus capsici]MDP1430800.1 helix-turn-helix domain-containing protein [Lysinibacillus capsici]
MTNTIHSSQWLSLKDAAKYTNVSYNTFIKFRHMGLKVCEIEGIKRVSKKEIDRFLEEHSF